MHIIYFIFPLLSDTNIITQFLKGNTIIKYKFLYEHFQVKYNYPRNMENDWNAVYT